jgi:hypothetical protein
MFEKEIEERAAQEIVEKVMQECYAMCGIW